jgi:hypothetical protein
MKELYDTYEWKKVCYSTFYKRYKKWIPLEDCFKIWHRAKIKNNINAYWRICTKCWVYKIWKEFFKTWCVCKECSSIIKKEYHIKNRDIILQKKKEKRKTELWKLRMKLDWIFYNDKNIKRIISLEPKYKREKRKHNWDIMKDKFFYFLDRWWERSLLKKIYWDYYLKNKDGTTY